MNENAIGLSSRASEELNHRKENSCTKLSEAS